MMKLSLALAATSLVALTSIGCAAGDDQESASTEAALNATTPIDAVTTLAFDARTMTLDFTYGMSGGCRRHTAETTIELQPTSFGHVGSVKVFDVAEGGQDFCEAFLRIPSSASLSSLLLRAGNESGADLRDRTVTVQLPRVELFARSVPAAAPPSGGFAVRDLSSVSVNDAGEFAFGYVTSGGCAEHTASASVELAADGPLTVAKVKVADVTSAPDPCEALVAVQGTANLHALVAAAANTAGVKLEDSRFMTVELPPVSIVAR